MEQTINQRIKMLIEYYKCSVNAFAKRVGVGQRTLANMFDRGTEPSSKTISSIIEALPEVNKNWLFAGEGDMFVSNEQRSALSTEQHAHTILYYPEVDASMGDVTFLDNPNEKVEEMIIPCFTDAQFAINAYGDSMYPVIKDGQIVMLSEWKEKFIEWGKIYMVVTRSGYRAIKRLFPVEGNAGALKCVSENVECYPPFELDWEDVARIYIVRGYISKETL